MYLETKIIETKRLILRPFCMEDADAVFENWASDPEATRYMSWPTHKSRADSRAYIAFAMEQYERAADANNMGICDTVCFAVLKSDYQKEHAV